MDPTNRPFRSLLYIPGSKTRALEKAQTLATDGIIFDLEDAVAVDMKTSARTFVADALRDLDYGNRSLMVRVNGFETEWATDDLAVIMEAGPEAILLPKVNSGADVKKLEAILDGHPKCKDTAIWAMMESPLSILNAQDIASASTRMKVHNAFRDQDGLRISCEQGRILGFDGKSLIHPDQLAVTNDIYRPSEEDIDLAHRQMAAFEEAEASGKGIAVLDGQIVENLHIVTARALIAKAEAIAASEN